jgi:MarR family transcriptional regulator, 2-MHQ and catechol-resistance regulon repressor
VGSRFRGTTTETRALDAYIKLRRAVNTLSERGAAAMRTAGLTESQFAVLETILHLGPLCQRDIAGKILRSAANLTTVLDNLERRGLVERRRGPEDRRVATVHLTPAGDELIRSLFPRHVAALVEAFAPLTAAEQEQLATLCRRLGRQEEG